MWVWSSLLEREGSEVLWSRCSTAVSDAGKGGVGPMTIAMLVENTVEATENLYN